MFGSMEYAFSHIPSARLIPLGELKKRLAEVDPEKGDLGDLSFRKPERFRLQNFK